MASAQYVSFQKERILMSQHAEFSKQSLIKQRALGIIKYVQNAGFWHSASDTTWNIHIQHRSACIWWLFFLIPAFCWCTPWKWQTMVQLLSRIPVPYERHKLSCWLLPFNGSNPGCWRAFWEWVYWRLGISLSVSLLPHFPLSLSSSL